MDTSLKGNLCHYSLLALVSMAALSEDVSSLRQGLKVVQDEMKNDPDNFIIFISSQENIKCSLFCCCVTLDLKPYSFHRQSEKKLDFLKTTYSKMEDAYSELCLMFSENPKTTDPSDFFCIFAKFIKDWKVS